MAYVYVPDDRNMCGIIQSMQDEQITAVKQASSQEDLSDEQLAALMNSERSTPEERNAIVPVGSQGVGRRWNRVGHVTPSSSTQATPTRTPSEQEAALREQIQDYCKRVDSVLFERKWGETNRRVVKYFGKPRTAMTLKELQRVMAWLEGNYPTGKSSGKTGPVSPVPTVSRS